MRRTLMIAAVAGLLATTAPAQWGRGFGRAMAAGQAGQSGTPGQRLERRLEFLAAYLNLSEGQKAQFKAAYEALNTKLQANIQKVQELRSKLQEAVRNNPTLIPTLAAEIGKLHGEMIAARAQTIVSLRNLLTQEQRDKLDKLCPRGCGVGGLGAGPLGAGRGWRL